jgi:hypothetical protein
VQGVAAAGSSNEGNGGGIAPANHVSRELREGIDSGQCIKLSQTRFNVIMMLYVVEIGKYEGAADYKVFRRFEDAERRFRGALGAKLYEADSDNVREALDHVKGGRAMLVDELARHSEQKYVLGCLCLDRPLRLGRTDPIRLFFGLIVGVRHDDH